MRTKAIEKFSKLYVTSQGFEDISVEDYIPERSNKVFLTIYDKNKVEKYDMFSIISNKLTGVTPDSFEHSEFAPVDIKGDIVVTILVVEKENKIVFVNLNTKEVHLHESYEKDLRDRISDIYSFGNEFSLLIEMDEVKSVEGQYKCPHFSYFVEKFKFDGNTPKSVSLSNMGINYYSTGKLTGLDTALLRTSDYEVTQIWNIEGKYAYSGECRYEPQPKTQQSPDGYIYITCGEGFLKFFNNKFIGEYYSVENDKEPNYDRYLEYIIPEEDGEEDIIRICKNTGSVYSTGYDVEFKNLLYPEEFQYFVPKDIEDDFIHVDDYIRFNKIKDISDYEVIPLSQSYWEIYPTMSGVYIFYSYGYENGEVNFLPR